MTDSMATLMGGKQLVAYYLDGTQEIVDLKQLPVRLLPQYLATIDDEASRLEMILGKPAGWADTITSDSHVELLEAGEGLNSDSFSAWLRRRVQRQEQLVPGSSGELGKQLLSASPTGSRNARSAVV
jgi:hypothetical protein